MNISDIIGHHRLINVAQKYHICRNCKYVDDSPARLTVGSPCPVCGVPSPGGLTFFDLSVLMMVELLQDAYVAIPEVPDEELDPLTSRKSVHSASVVIVFCTLKELLLERLLSALMDAQHIPDRVRSRLFADNNSHSQRLTKLFPALACQTWDEAVAAIDTVGSSSFNSISAFMKRITDIRNEFIHEGSSFAINKTLAVDSLKAFVPMMNLHIHLHNKLVHPSYVGGKPTTA